MTLKAIFTGSLKEGFTLKAILAAEAAQQFLFAHGVSGNKTYIEAVDISDPEGEVRGYKATPDGEHLAILGSVPSGIELIYGPFPDEETAYEFSERKRRDDEEWNTIEIRA